MELTDYRRELIARVQEKALDENLFDQEAFFHVVCDMLRDSEAITDYQPIEPGYRFGEGTNRFMAVDGYDQSSFEMDESIIVITCDDYSTRAGDEQVSTIQAKDCMRYIQAMRRYIQKAVDGSFLEQAEESSAAWEFASFIHEHVKSISRFRLYFVTDRKYTGRDSSIKDPTDFYLEDRDNAISFEAHVWDLRHLMEASQAAAPLEHLTVDLGYKGIPAVKAPDSGNGMETYLMFVAGQTLSDWYEKHGSKLMEANVRSFLSLRGKVNRGIRNTLEKEPDRFVAYNNGLSATASMVDMNGQGYITAIHDLQIVNGGQTTASIFYSQKGGGIDLSKVAVPVKLVVVREDVARELVPCISRYTNSQNKVAETDFSSNSEYQVRLSALSQQVLTPPLPGANPTHWYYERTRGQYDSERNRRSTSERKQFEKLNPSKQRIKMIDAPKYLMCWEGYPHVASLGSQKCFARFVDMEAAKGQKSVEALDADFFKQLVCKRIIFDAIYKSIKTADWYKGAYQSNIAQYAVAKYAFDLRRSCTGFGFNAIWRAQYIDDTSLAYLMKAAEQASEVLNDPNRPVQNVSEWAKKEACWDILRQRPSCLDAVFVDFAPRRSSSSAADVATVRSVDDKDTPQSAITDSKQDELMPRVPSTSKRTVPRHKAAVQPEAARIDDWTAAPVDLLRKLYSFGRARNLLSPKAEMSLNHLMRGDTTGININALDFLLSNANKCGFRYEEDSKIIAKKAAVRKKKTVAAPKTAAKKKPETQVLASAEHDLNYQRNFLMAIPVESWRTILDGARYRNILTAEVMDGIMSIDKHIPLTDQQTRCLWSWRQKLISRGFPESQFAPRPGTGISAVRF
ncbi:hypothetical protein EP30_09490 [Bifidobacterium sp. UTCIF-39]|uniref:AIPR family protein n=1 Tax=Bifidobacterium sp. UTCIF-39 TaxID=1465359 RepID=UPI0021597EFE|nr:AIPR family protein [Bifidobacterium sp. UTCIF-39]TPF96098.1 hypothetical protein EP30_09490 [Bifidobacterium sp. UTCIF-39]